MIEFLHVTKSYDGRFDALKDVSLFIDTGEFLFLTGQSGAGKTTLLKHIFMEQFPTEGMVSVFGKKCVAYANRNSLERRGLKRLFGRKRVAAEYPRSGEISHLRRDIGIVFQDIRLLSDRTVFDNVAFAARIGGGSERLIKRRVFEALTAVGLSHKNSSKPSQLSGGEQQRIAIARAIVNEPKLLIADEPTGNLDRLISDEIFSLVEKINSWGTTVIMSTHDQSFIERTHYREVALAHGQIIRGGGNRIITHR